MNELHYDVDGYQTIFLLTHKTKNNGYLQTELVQIP